MPTFKRAELLAFVLAAAGGGACIFLLASAQSLSSLKLVIPPSGAGCVLVFLLPDSPLAQPRNVIGVHLISTLAGLIVLKLLGPGAAGEGVAVGAAILAMALTRTVHPPAGADPLVAFAAGAGLELPGGPGPGRRRGGPRLVFPPDGHAPALPPKALRRGSRGRRQPLNASDRPMFLRRRR